MKANSARLFGIFFILSFITYATGSGFMDIVQNSQAQPSEILENKVSLTTGAILIAFFHTLFNFGLLAIMFTVLKPGNRLLSVIYLACGITGTLMLALGAVFLLLPIPISETINQSDDSTSFSLILRLSSGGNFYAYQIGMAIWGIGGLALGYLLYASKLVPTALVVCGYIGYSVFIVGCLLELFGLPYGVVCSIPGGLYEITLSIWFITKGFNHIAIDTNRITSKYEH